MFNHNHLLRTRYFGFQKKDEKNDATDDEALSWKEILDSNIEEATTKKQKSKLKKEKEVSEDAGTSTITISGKQKKSRNHNI